MGTSRRLTHRHVTLALSAALVFASCGGDDDSETTVGTVPPVSVTSSTTFTTTTAAPTTTSSIAPTRDFTGSPAFNSSSSVTTSGIDAVFFGMTLGQASNAVEAEFAPTSEPVDPVCQTYFPAGGPDGVVITVTAGTIERVDITTEELTTRSGAGVGMTEEALFELFGSSLSQEPRDGGGNTITFTPSDPADAEFRVIFETDGTAVTSFRSGRLPQVASTSPCS